MSEKKPFVLRIDPEKLKALEKWAADEFRSTNGRLSIYSIRLFENQADGK